MVVLVLLLLLLPACKRAVDPLDEYRIACHQLAVEKQLREGLGVEQCAKEMKAAADAADPARRSEELVQRIAALVLAGRQGRDPAQVEELREDILAVQGLGRPAVPALMSRLTGSQDGELRLAVARALVHICGPDCGQRDYGCIVPALLEYTGPERLEETRKEALRRLSTCTGRQLGDDAAAWRRWWEGGAK